MANLTVPKTIYDAIDEFHLNMLCAGSMAYILSDLVDDAEFKTTLSCGDSAHPVQKMYACITSIQHQLTVMDALVNSMPALHLHTAT